MINFCFLLAVAVINCDPRAQELVPIVETLPPGWWQLHHSITVKEPGTHGKACDLGDRGRICLITPQTTGLPVSASAHTVFHETAHWLSWANDGELLHAWQQAIWPGGMPRKPLPTGYVRKQWDLHGHRPVDISTVWYNHRPVDISTVWYNHAEWTAISEDFADSMALYLGGRQRKLDRERLRFIQAHTGPI